MVFNSRENKMAKDLDIHGIAPGRNSAHSALVYGRKGDKSGTAPVLHMSSRRSINAAIALIEQAASMLDSAEQTIERQSKRIQRLEDLMTVDELTGLKNRRGFFDCFVRELDRCERGLSMGGLVILIEMDNLHVVNETHGLKAGDACLRLLARTLLHDIRIMDVAARLKSDEFALLFSNSGKTEAAARAEDIMRAIGNLSMVWNGEEFPVQASLALQSYRKGDEARGLIRAAHEALKLERIKRRDNQQNKGGKTAHV